MWELPTFFREKGGIFCYGHSVKWDSGAFWASTQHYARARGAIRCQVQRAFLKHIMFF